jgi:hypothetical protein
VAVAVGAVAGAAVVAGAMAVAGGGAAGSVVGVGSAIGAVTLTDVLGAGAGAGPGADAAVVAGPETTNWRRPLDESCVDEVRLSPRAVAATARVATSTTRANEVSPAIRRG